MYDDNNIFAKILRSEIPCNKVYEDDDVLFFYDINPVAKVHVLGIPSDWNWKVDMKILIARSIIIFVIFVNITTLLG